MAESTITFLVLGGAVVAFLTNKVPVALVALGVSLSLWATGVLELEQALGGFGDPTVIFIAATFVVAEALDVTGVTTWVGQQLLARSGSSRAKAMVLVAVACAVLTALITPNASVAALIPAVVVLAIGRREPSSQLLIPLAFSAHAGSMLALTGSPVNVLIAEAADDAGVSRPGFFEFALVGVPLLVGTVVLAVTIGPRLLPRRNGKAMPADVSALATELVGSYGLGDEDPLFDRSRGTVEVVVPPRSPVIGEEAFVGMTTDRGDLVVLGLLRHGEPVGPRTISLQAGDALLLQGAWTNLDDDLPVGLLPTTEASTVRSQAVPLGTGATEALVVLGAMVVALATGALPPAVASLGAAIVLVLLGVVTMEGAYRAVSWNTVVLVGGMIPLSTAMSTTGAADTVADALVDAVGDLGPYALLVGVFVLVAVFGQLISNTATALIVIPIAIAAAADLDVSALPVLMTVNVAASGALLTPVATPANMMVMEPGGYRFGDYARFGLPVMAWYAVVAILLVPLIWSF
jgi:di/tricarboxylate transporter